MRPVAVGRMAVLPLLIANWLAFSQLVSATGVIVWVGGGSLLTVLVYISLRDRGHRNRATLVGVLLALAFPLLAEFFGGSNEGPISRSTLIACAGAFAMAMLACSHRPRLLVVPAVLVFCGYLALATQPSPIWVVTMWVLGLIATMLIFSGYAPHDWRADVRAASLLIQVAILSIAVTGTYALLSPLLGEHWSVTESLPSTTSSIPPESQWSIMDILRGIGIALLTGIALGLTLMLIWSLLAALLWQRRRLQLRKGDPTASIAGAWHWVMLRRRQYACPLPPSASPDIAAHMAREAGEPELARLAELVASVAYDMQFAPTELQAKEAWTMADRAGRAPSGAGLSRRATWALRTPGQASTVVKARAR